MEWRGGGVEGWRGGGVGERREKRSADTLVRSGVVAGGRRASFKTSNPLARSESISSRFTANGVLRNRHSARL